MIRNLLAEAIGTFFLLATIVGSGIMAENLAGGNTGIALLGNTISTGAMLFVGCVRGLRGDSRFRVDSCSDSVRQQARRGESVWRRRRGR